MTSIHFPRYSTVRTVRSGSRASLQPHRCGYYFLTSFRGSLTSVAVLRRLFFTNAESLERAIHANSLWVHAGEGVTWWVRPKRLPKLQVTVQLKWSGRRLSGKHCLKVLTNFLIHHGYPEVMVLELLLAAHKTGK